jgi:prepilin-type processing-associated H-X9-DG protein
MTPELREQAKKDFAAFSKVVDAHCDYVYLGNGLKMEDVANNQNTVLCYEKPEVASGGINALFWDGHVEIIMQGRLEEEFKATNEFLKKNKLPEVDVEVLKKGAAGRR